MMKTYTLTSSLSLKQFRQLYYQLASHHFYSVLLDSCGLHHASQNSTELYVMAFGAKQVIGYHTNNLWHTDNTSNKTTFYPIDSFKALKEYIDSQPLLQHPECRNDLLSKTPFLHGWIAALSYDLSNLIEPNNLNPGFTQKTPQLILFEPIHTITWLSDCNTVCITTYDNNWLQQVESLIKEYEKSQSEIVLTLSHPLYLESQSTLETFTQQIEMILSHILEGDIYQANLSIPFIQDKALTLQDCFALYNALVEINPSPFSGLFVSPEITIISNSPERLVQYTATTNTLQALPIAGTRGRGKNEREDEAIGKTLLENAKEQAEHLMLLDLLRNDLGRVAVPGSVSVPKSFFLERYSHVTHLVSEVSAKKAPQYTIWDTLGSVFPGGTITGCPKVRCMEILSQVETKPRGFYTGSMGYIDFRGNSDWNILIRSLFNDPTHNMLYTQFGAGIVADSIAENEYKECYRKYAALEKALTSLASNLESPHSVTLK